MLRRTFLAQALLALRQDRIDQAEAILKKAVDSKDLTAASLTVRQGGRTISSTLGRVNAKLKDDEDLPFLIASITKPMTATGLMILVDRRQISLADPVRKYIPDFHGGDRDMVTIRHLLTHTSGLPDMLPENDQLRARHAPLKDFVAGTCRTPLLFKPGTECRYQSMGILLAADIAERVTRMPFRDFLKKELFNPLDMKQTSLGLGGRRIADLAPLQVTGNLDWNWNSPYWRDLGAPWGGAHSTSADIVKFLRYFLHPTDKVLKVATAEQMIANQNRGLNKPWGIGWMLERARLGKASSERAFGHWGSTGTISWADPATDTAFCLLTTKPEAESRETILRPVSDLVSEAAAG